MGVRTALAEATLARAMLRVPRGELWRPATRRFSVFCLRVIALSLLKNEHDVEEKVKQVFKDNSAYMAALSHLSDSGCAQKILQALCKTNLTSGKSVDAQVATIAVNAMLTLLHRREQRVEEFGKWVDYLHRELNFADFRPIRGRYMEMFPIMCIKSQLLTKARCSKALTDNLQLLQSLAPHVLTNMFSSSFFSRSGSLELHEIFGLKLEVVLQSASGFSVGGERLFPSNLATAGTVRPRRRRGR